MKSLLLLAFLCPLPLWAQRESLKPIGYQELGTIIRNGGASVQRIYNYDGVDIIKPNKELPPYLLALGDSATTQAYNQYRQIRDGHTVASVFGLLFTAVGLSVGGSYLHAVREQQNAQYQSSHSPSRQDQPTYRGRGITALGIILLGGILCGVGSSSYKVNQSLHRAVQTYNRTLSEQGISWHLEPYSGNAQAGISLVGQF